MKKSTLVSLIAFSWLFLGACTARSDNQGQSDDKIFQSVQEWVQQYAKTKRFTFLDIKFGTPMDSGASLVPDHVKEKAAPGTKVYPVRWHGKGAVSILAGPWHNEIGSETFVQDLYFYTDAFNEGMIFQEQPTVSVDDRGLSIGTPVGFLPY
jgi:hypothetical protein